MILNEHEWKGMVFTQGTDFYLFLFLSIHSLTGLYFFRTFHYVSPPLGNWPDSINFPNFKKSVYKLCPKTEKPVKPVIGRFIDPFKDFAFKRLFLTEPNKDLLISFSRKEKSSRDFRFSGTATGQPVHWVWLTEEGSDRPFYDKLCYTFLEIPNFNKGGDELETEMDKWMFVLKNLHRLDKIPVILNKRIFKKLFKIAEVSNLKREEYMQYEKSLMDKWNENAIVKTAENRGKEEEKTDAVRNLIIKFGFNDEQAADAAEVPIAFVEKVRASLEKKK